MLLLCWRHYQLEVKRHFWGADSAALTRQQTTRQQTETTAPARLQPGSAESAVQPAADEGLRRPHGLSQIACLLLLADLLTYLLTYLTPYLMSTITYLTPYLTPYSLTVLTTLPASSQATLLGYV